GITGTGQTKTLSFSPTSLTYAAQTDGTTSVAQSVTVNSIGTASVTLSNIQLTGANAADYAISANTCGPTLASGANCSVSITFTPSATGTRTAALTLTGDASGSPQSVAITGTGQTKTLSFSPTSLTYAAQTDGTTSAAQSVTVNSIGTAAVALATIHLTGSNAADYAISANACGPTLASGANCSVSITFTPSATGTRTASLTF